MKKLLLALAILAGFVAAAPRAEAGQYRKIYTRHGVQYVNKYSGYYPAYYSGDHYRHHRHYRSYRYAPYYRSYPVYTSYRTYPAYYDSGYYNTGYYNSGYYGCHHSSRPRVAISFGF